MYYDTTVKAKLLRFTDLTLYAAMVGFILVPPITIFPPFPEASEVFKQAMVTLFGAVITLSFLTRAILARQVRITSSVVLPFYIIFVLVIGTSTLFSIDPIASLLTLRGAASPSILIATVTALVFIAMSNQLISLSWIMRLLGVMSITGAIVAAVALFELVTGLTGTDKLMLTILGSPASTSWAIASILPLTISLYVAYTYSTRLLVWLPASFISVIFFLLIVLQLAFLIVTNTGMLWLTILVAGLLLLVFSYTITAFTRYRIPIMVGVVLVAVLTVARLLVFPAPSTQSPVPTFPIAVRVLYSEPVPLRLLFGSGPATFLQTLVAQSNSVSTTAMTPVAIEQQSNTFLYLLTTVGIVGLTAYLFLFIAALVLILQALNRLTTLSTSRSGPASQRMPPLLLGMLASLLFWFMGGFTATANTSTIVLFVSFLALVVGLAKVLGAPVVETLVFTWGVKRVIKKSAHRTDFLLEVLPIVLFIVSVLAIILLLSVTARLVGAEVALAQSHQRIARGELRGAYAKALQAVSLNPYADYTHRTLSLTCLSLASAIGTSSTSHNLSQTQALLSQATTEARAAVRINKLNATNWIVLAEVYRALGGISEEARDFARNAYWQAAQLEPENQNLKRLAEQLRIEEAQEGQVAGEASP